MLFLKYFHRYVELIKTWIVILIYIIEPNCTFYQPIAWTLNIICPADFSSNIYLPRTIQSVLQVGSQGRCTNSIIDPSPVDSIYIMYNKKKIPQPVDVNDYHSSMHTIWLSRIIARPCVYFVFILTQVIIIAYR